MKLKSFLVKVRKDLPKGDPTAYALFFCRGSKGCERSALKQAVSKAPCDNCMRPDEKLTVGEVADRLSRTDA